MRAEAAAARAVPRDEDFVVEVRLGPLRPRRVQRLAAYRQERRGGAFAEAVALRRLGERLRNAEDVLPCEFACAPNTSQGHDTQSLRQDLRGTQSTSVRRQLDHFRAPCGSLMRESDALPSALTK